MLIVRHTIVPFVYTHEREWHEFVAPISAIVFDRFSFAETGFSRFSHGYFQNSVGCCSCVIDITSCLHDGGIFCEMISNGPTGFEYFC